MSKFNTPHDTQIGSAVSISELRHKIEHAKAMGRVHYETLPIGIDGTNGKLYLIEGGNVESDIIGYFNQPIITFNKGDDDLEAVIDVRKFGTYDTKQFLFRVRNHAEYEWHINRALLSMYWVSQRVNALRDISAIAVAVYSQLISQTISRKYALDLGDQFKIGIISAFHYYCLFESEDLDESEKNRLMGRIARELHIPAQKVVEVLADIDHIDGIPDLCNTIKSSLGTVRLDEFTPGILCELVRSCWFGTDSYEHVVVGLEHIPTWLCIIYSCLTQTSYKRTGITQILDRVAKGAPGESFVKSMKRVLNSEEVSKIMEGQP